MSAVDPRHALSQAEKTSRTDDERVASVDLLPPPEHLIRFFPIEGTPIETLVGETRARIRRLLHASQAISQVGQADATPGDDWANAAPARIGTAAPGDDRLLVIIGPCSIHDPSAALEYARKLAGERRRFADTLEIVMRVYFEKPRTSVGWKGLINDPYLDESYRINEGLRIARSLLVDINRLGVPAGSELLDVISPQYIGDLIAWGAIGARTTESQIHRELASGISAPIGFKNGTDGNVKIAIDAMQAASHPHHFLGVHKNGQIAMIGTRGNPDCHVILRGGSAPNYDAASVDAASAALAGAGLPSSLMIDCSHGNSSKQHQKQLDVVSDIASRIAAGNSQVFGVMIESHLEAGAQKFAAGKDDPAALRHGMSITDACIGWDDSVRALETLSDAVARRRR